MPLALGWVVETTRIIPALALASVNSNPENEVMSQQKSGHEAPKQKPIYVRTQLGFWVLIRQAALRTRHPGGMSGYVGDLLQGLRQRIQDDAESAPDAVS